MGIRILICIAASDLRGAVDVGAWVLEQPEKPGNSEDYERHQSRRGYLRMDQI